LDSRRRRGPTVLPFCELIAPLALAGVDACYDTKLEEMDRLISKIDRLLGTVKGEALRQAV
jgi:hypothetical protein